MWIRGNQKKKKKKKKKKNTHFEEENSSWELEECGRREGGRREDEKEDGGGGEGKAKEEGGLCVFVQFERTCLLENKVQSQKQKNSCFHWFAVLFLTNQGVVETLKREAPIVMNKGEKWKKER